MIRKGAFGRWYIFHSFFLNEAWSGSRWVKASDDGVPLGEAQVCNFETREAAERYLVDRLPENPL